VLLPSVFIVITGCNTDQKSSKSSENCIGTGSGVYCSYTKPSPGEVSAWDVFCFRDNSSPSQPCYPDDIYKIPRGSFVSTYLKTTTSVQNGSKIEPMFRPRAYKEKISVPEMESLFNTGSKVYSMGMNTLSGSPEQYSVYVLIFDKDSGKFRKIGEGISQKMGEEKSELFFTTGEEETRDKDKRRLI
jgi:hypothetical protein